MSKTTDDKSLDLTAFPLRSEAASEVGR